MPRAIKLRFCSRAIHFEDCHVPELVAKPTGPYKVPKARRPFLRVCNVVCWNFMGSRTETYHRGPLKALLLRKSRGVLFKTALKGPGHVDRVCLDLLWCFAATSPSVEPQTTKTRKTSTYCTILKLSCPVRGFATPNLPRLEWQRYCLRSRSIFCYSAYNIRMFLPHIYGGGNM